MLVFFCFHQRLRMLGPYADGLPLGPAGDNQSSNSIGRRNTKIASRVVVAYLALPPVCWVIRGSKVVRGLTLSS